MPEITPPSPLMLCRRETELFRGNVRKWKLHLEHLWALQSGVTDILVHLSTTFVYISNSDQNGSYTCLLKQTNSLRILNQFEKCRYEMIAVCHRLPWYRKRGCRLQSFMSSIRLAELSGRHSLSPCMTGYNILMQQSLPSKGSIIIGTDISPLKCTQGWVMQAGSVSWRGDILSDLYFSFLVFILFLSWFEKKTDTEAIYSKISHRKWDLTEACLYWTCWSGNCSQRSLRGLSLVPRSFPSFSICSALFYSLSSWPYCIPRWHITQQHLRSMTVKPLARCGAVTQLANCH